MTAEDVGPKLIAPNVPWRRIALELVSVTLLTLAVMALLASFFSLKVVRGDSMHPLLRDGDRVLAFRYAPHEYRRDYVILFSGVEHDLVKRVAAVAGDRLDCRDNVLYVNAREVPGYCQNDGNEPHPYVEDILPQGTVFVVGDNHESSYDSRAWGPLPLERVYGRVIAVVWPLNRISFIVP